MVCGEDDAEESLREAGSSSQKRDSTHLIIVTPLSSTMSPDQLFECHCRFRPKRMGRSFWEGAIIFVGRPGFAKSELTDLEPFSNIGCGHHVEHAPVQLLSLLLAMNKASPIYAEKWLHELTAITGLADLKRLLHDAGASSVPDEHQLFNIKNAIDQLLKDKLLNKLLAHVAVIGLLRSLSQSIETTGGFSEQTFQQLVLDLRDTMKAYL